MSSLKAIHGNFISEVRHDLLEPFASAQMGSVFPSSCLNPKSGKQARNGFQGSILRFEDGSTWVCPPNDSVSFPRPGEARQTEVVLVPRVGTGLHGSCSRNTEIRSAPPEIGGPGKLIL